MSAVTNEGFRAEIRNVTATYFDMGFPPAPIVFAAEESPKIEIPKGVQYFNIMISEIPE